MLALELAMELNPGPDPNPEGSSKSKQGLGLSSLRDDPKALMDSGLHPTTSGVGPTSVRCHREAVVDIRGRAPTTSGPPGYRSAQDPAFREAEV